MKKPELVKALGEYGYIKNEVGYVIDDLFHVIAEELAKGGSVFIRGFGTFEIKTIKGRRGYNKLFEKSFVYDDYYAIKFTPAASLKEAVKKQDPQLLFKTESQKQLEINKERDGEKDSKKNSSK